VVDKVALQAVLCTQLEARLAAVEQVAAMARDEASNAETKQEGKYDTRSTEASYLARGQAWRIVELRELLLWAQGFDPLRPLIDPVQAQIGALVQLRGASDPLVFLAPVGGPKLAVAGHEVAVISLRSPLGAAMVGLGEGDSFEVDIPSGLCVYEIEAVW
jgi:transcription elongation GreA/GreB family factor